MKQLDSGEAKHGGRPVLVAAGGTGGHLFPAQSLSAELQARGYVVDLITDERALRYGGEFPARAMHTIPAATPTGGSIVSKATAAMTLGWGTVRALMRLRRLKPLCIVGFGGYPTVPPMLAASILGIPGILHEQNAVMGRANRFLASRAQKIATGFPNVGGISAELAGRCVHTGNPVRPNVIDAARQPYPDRLDGKLHVLVTGGSQGARVMSEIVPGAIATLSAEERDRIALVQQARGEDERGVRLAYKTMNFTAEIEPFFADLPQRIAAAHLVVARSGASTVSELAVIGRPSILVPFPFALDQDQAANAAQLAESGAARVIPQSEFSTDRLAAELREALGDEDGLRQRAAAAREAGIPDAASRLADVVQATIGG
ncbi:MAG: undecaprenyldiphospho-muramoylpentapeptide beta-N-acetylglucosaminyltransferase [Hyphomicrobiales bacterium]|nr:undecaprenyldiphospho-muramoylpentapeptide beta-N-acetylglucosaminyltransferase [Hyphomicrobiales bacterium]